MQAALCECLLWRAGQVSYATDQAAALERQLDGNSSALFASLAADSGAATVCCTYLKVAIVEVRTPVHAPCFTTHSDVLLLCGGCERSLWHACARDESGCSAHAMVRHTSRVLQLHLAACPPHGP